MMVCVYAKKNKAYVANVFALCAFKVTKKIHLRYLVLTLVMSSW